MNRAERQRTARKRPPAPTSSLANGHPHQPVHCVIEDEVGDDGAVERTHYRLSEDALELLESTAKPSDRDAVARLWESGYFLNLFLVFWHENVDSDSLLRLEHQIRPLGETEFVPLVWE